jgi:hypothetical protein
MHFLRRSKPNVLIVEFGGNHSETLGFFIQTINRLGLRPFVYFGGGSWQASDLLANGLNMHFHILKTLDETLEHAKKNLFNCCIFNSARNLRVGRSPCVALFKSMLSTIGQDNLIVQIHSADDLRLDFLIDHKPHIIGPSPLIGLPEDKWFFCQSTTG